MKKPFLIFVFALALSLAGAGYARAQEKRLNSSPKAFQIFFAKFIKAVVKSDKTAVAGMTRFPFRYGFDAGDEGIMSKAQFGKRFSEIFGNSRKKFITEKNPLFSRGDGGTFVVSTEDAAHLIFVHDKSGFKFNAYMVEP